MSERTTVIVSQGDTCELCLIYNEDSVKWTDYVIGYLNEDQFETKILKLKDTDIFPKCNSQTAISIASAKAFLVFVTPGHLELLSNNPEASYAKHVRNFSATGVLFLLGIEREDIRSENLEGRFVHFSAWNIFQSDQHRDLVLKVVEIIESESRTIDLEPDPVPVVEAPPPRPIRAPTVVARSAQDDKYDSMSPPPSLTGGRSRSPRKPPGYDKVEIWKFQVLPFEVKCEEPTPVVVSFSSPLPTIEPNDIEILLQGQNSNLDTIKVKAQKLNPHTLYFNAPEHTEGEVTMKIMMEGRCIGAETLAYKPSISECSARTHTFYLYLLDLVMGLAVENGAEKYVLDEIAQMMFSDSSKLPAQAYEELFKCYEYVMSENSSYEIPTLLHLSAKFGLKGFATAMIDLPGAMYAHSITNSNSQYPEDMAKSHDHDDLSEMLTAARDMAETFDSIYDKMMAPYINVTVENKAISPGKTCVAPPSEQRGAGDAPPRPHSFVGLNDELYLDMTGHLSAEKKEDGYLKARRERSDSHPAILVTSSGGQRKGSNSSLPGLPRQDRPLPSPGVPPRVPDRSPKPFPPDTCDIEDDENYLEVCLDAPHLGSKHNKKPPRSRNCSESSDSSAGSYEEINDALQQYGKTHDLPLGDTFQRTGPQPPIKPRKPGSDADGLPPKLPSRPATPARSLTPRSMSPACTSRPKSPEISSEVPPPVPDREPPTCIETDEYYSEVQSQSAPYTSKKQAFNWDRSVSCDPYISNKMVAAFRTTESSPQLSSENQDITEEAPAPSMQSRSQQSLLDIINMVKNKEITQSQAEMMFEEWKATFNQGKTGSFKERQQLLKKVAESLNTEKEPHYADKPTGRAAQSPGRKTSFLAKLKKSIRPGGSKGPSTPKAANGVATKSTGSQPDTKPIQEEDYLAFNEPPQRASTLSNGSSGSRGSTVSQDSGTDSMVGPAHSASDDIRRIHDGVSREERYRSSRPKSVRVTELANRLASHEEDPPQLPPRMRPPTQSFADESEESDEDEDEESTVQRRPLPPTPKTTDNKDATLTRDSSFPGMEVIDREEKPSVPSRRLPPPLPDPEPVCPPPNPIEARAPMPRPKPPSDSGDGPPLPEQSKPEVPSGPSKPSFVSEIASGLAGLRKTSTSQSDSGDSSTKTEQSSSSVSFTGRLKPVPMVRPAKPGPPVMNKPLKKPAVPTQGEETTVTGASATPWGPRVKSRAPKTAPKPPNRPT